MRRYFFSKLTYLGQNTVFHSFAGQIVSTLSIIRTTEVRVSFANTNYGMDLIIKRFHEENSKMSGLFSKKNLLLWGMQGNNGLSAKTLKNFQSQLYSHSVLTFDRRQICSASCMCLNII